MGERKVKSGSLLYFFSSLNITLHTYIYMYYIVWWKKKYLVLCSIVLRLSMAKFIFLITSDLKAVNLWTNFFFIIFNNFFLDFWRFFKFLVPQGSNDTRNIFSFRYCAPLIFVKMPKLQVYTFQQTVYTNIFNSHCIKFWHNWVKYHLLNWWYYTVIVFSYFIISRKFTGLRNTK